MRRWVWNVAGLGALLVLTAAPARAGVVLTAAQVGSDVVISGGGTVDLTGMTFVISDSSPSGIIPDGAGLLTGPTSANSVDAYVSVNGPNNFGTGGTVGASSGSGDSFGVIDNSGLLLLLVPHGYASGAALSGSMTFDNATIASLGMTPGSYTWTWGPVAQPDSLTLNVVPEPSGLALGGIALVLGGLWTRRRRARARASAA